MPHLKGLSGLRTELNARYLGDWPLKIGLYMINFGTIELISYQYLNSLEATRLEFDKTLHLLLGQRIDRILELTQASTAVADIDKTEISGLWQQARKLARWRNIIAHNPVLPVWKPGSDSNKDPPDLIGVPDMRQLKVSNQSKSISLEGMNSLINESAELGNRLLAAASRIKTA